MSIDKKTGRIFMFAAALVIVALFSWEAFSEENSFNIVEVKRNIPLSDDEKIYKDYYINAGSDSGLKEDMVVSAYRKVAVKDASGTQSYGEMLVPVGQLKIIFVSNKVAVAREHKVFSSEDKPWLDQLGFMNGDRIDIK